MTKRTAQTIPGVGPQLPQPDPRGWLVFAFLPDDVAAQEDSTQAADFERGLDRYWRAFDREVTAAEKQLLVHIGHPVTSGVLTSVSFPYAGIRCRRWIALEQTP